MPRKKKKVETIMLKELGDFKFKKPLKAVIHREVYIDIPALGFDGHGEDVEDAIKNMEEDMNYYIIQAFCRDEDKVGNDLLKQKRKFYRLVEKKKEKKK